MLIFVRKWLLVFGGFHDNLRDSKYFNDVYAFDLESRAWSKLSTTGSEPSPRSNNPHTEKEYQYSSR